MRASDDGGKSGNTLATPHHTTLPYKWVDVCWCHHAPLVSLNVVVVDTHHGVDETRARMCGTHHSLTGVCATCGVEVAMVAIQPFITYTRGRVRRAAPKAKKPHKCVCVGRWTAWHWSLCWCCQSNVMAPPWSPSPLLCFFHVSCDGRDNTKGV